MPYLAAKVVFDHPEPTLAVELVADLFHRFGLQGVAIESPETDPDADWAEDAPGPPDIWAVIGYFHIDQGIEDRCHRLEADLAGLAQTVPLSYRVLYERIDEQDWAEAWKAHFRTERITSRLIVTPTWQPYTPGPGETVIAIDPGMAFGTGTHPTTAMCLTLVETFLRPGDRFLDVGTGSGILLAAAAKLGAKDAVGIDRDPVAVTVARRNLVLNRIDERRFTVIEADLVPVLDRRFELVAANILTHVILRLLDSLETVLTSDGIVIVSGITLENRPTVEAKLADAGFNPITVREQEGWVAIAAGRSGRGRSR